MGKNLKSKGLLIACGLQFVLIGAMFISAYSPVYLGKEVKVVAKGIDPRSLLAGNFVRLDYGISRKELRKFKDKSEIFLCLNKIGENLYAFDKIQSKAPKNQLYIKIDVKRGVYDSYSINIEKYFTTREKAQEIEKKLNKNNLAIVSLKIFQGKARIVDLEVESVKKLSLDNLDKNEFLSNDEIDEADEVKTIELPQQQEH